MFEPNSELETETTPEIVEAIEAKEIKPAKPPVPLPVRYRGLAKKPFRKRNIPELLRPEEILSMTGTAKAGTIAAMVTPEQMLQKAARRTYYLIYCEAMDLMLNGQTHTAKYIGMKMLWEFGNGIIGGSKNRNLKNQGADVVPGVTNIQIRGVKPPVPIDDADTDDEA